jgi:hypothetical protein
MILPFAADKHDRVGAALIAIPRLGHIRKSGRSYDSVPVNDESAPAR